jgi:DNA-binding response OmpR family regulator
MKHEIKIQPTTVGGPDAAASCLTVPTSCILIAESDAALRTACGNLLVDAGFDIVEAADGEAAWEALLSSHYDLVITAHALNKESGPALIRRMRVAGMWQPVILTSEDTSCRDEWSKDPWQRVDAIITKPYTVHDLLSRVSDLLRSPSRAPFPLGMASGH